MEETFSLQQRRQYHGDLVPSVNTKFPTQRLLMIRVLMFLSIVAQIFYTRHLSMFYSSGWEPNLLPADFDHPETPTHTMPNNSTSAMGLISKGFESTQKPNASVVRMQRGGAPRPSPKGHSRVRAKPPNTEGAFIHIGKCGGSTMTSQLANGCHSWVPKPCFTIHNETIISRSTTYYHTPDFPRGTNNQENTLQILCCTDS